VKQAGVAQTAVIVAADGEAQSEIKDGGSARPRVALVTFGVMDRYAVPQIVAHLIRRLHDRVDFVVISHSLPEDLKRVVEWRRIWVPRRLPFRARYAIFFLLAALRLGRVRVDLVHTFGSHPVVPNRVDLASIHFCHSAYYEVAPERSSRLLRELSTALERWSYGPARARVLAAPSQWTKRQLERHFRDTEVVVIPNGVDTDRFSPDSDARRKVRTAEGISDREVVALYVGRLWHGKGLDIAIEAMAALTSSGAKLRLWALGGGDPGEFVRLAERLGVRDTVRFFGRRDDAERFYQAADIFVSPSVTETFGLASYEAAASGLPLVATSVGGIEELLGDGKAGFVLERTPTAFAEAMSRLAADPGLRQRMGAAARERALRFTWEHAAASLMDVYSGLLHKPAALVNAQ